MPQGGGGGWQRCVHAGQVGMGQFRRSEGFSSSRRKHLFSALLLLGEHLDLADITALQPWELKAGATGGLTELIPEKP